MTLAALIALFAAAWLVWAPIVRHRLRILARHTLQALHRDGRGLVWWLDFGSLLGLRREGDIIKHDNDVDVCVLVRGPDDEARLRAVLRSLERRHGLRTQYKKYKAISGVTDKFPDNFVICVDLYHTTMDGDTVRGATGPTSDAARALIFGADGGGPLRWWPGVGAYARTPRDVDGLLVWRYGPDWRTPRILDKGRNTILSSIVGGGDRAESTATPVSVPSE